MLAEANPEALADELKRTGYLVTHARELGDGASLDVLTSWLRCVSYEDLVLFNI